MNLSSGDGTVTTDELGIYLYMIWYGIKIIFSLIISRICIKNNGSKPNVWLKIFLIFF